MNTSAKKYDVAIIGCGPVGATLANYLSQFGHSVAIFDRHKDVFFCPRAGGLDDEALRILDTLGVLQVLKDNNDYFEADLILCDSNEKQISAFNRGRVGDEDTDGHAGYPTISMFYQPNMERALRAAYADSSLVTPYLGYDVLSVEDGESSAVIRYKERDNDSESKGEIEERYIEAEYIVGCDGANSLVQKALGVGETNFNYSESYLIIDAHVKDSNYLKARFPDGAKMIFDPVYAGVIGQGAHGYVRLDFLIHKDSETSDTLETQEDFERAAKALIDARNFDAEKLDIIRLVKYDFQARTPDKWRVNRMLVAGDAAHLTPPWSGQGLNMGMRDAANLAFKLNMVLTGLAGEQLLNTYTQERSPVSLETIKAAVNTGKLMETTNPFIVVLRNLALKLIGKSEMVARAMAKQWQNKPPYKDGFFGNSHPSSGSWMIQPAVRDRQGNVMRMDKLIGQKFALISTDSSMGESVYRFLTELDGVVLKLDRDFKDHEGRFMRWCKENKATTVLIRPDRYVFDAGNDGDQLCASLFESIEKYKNI